MSEGDLVELSLPPDNLLRAAVLVYGLPLAGAIGGAALAYGSGLGDAGAALLALAGVAVGLAAGRMRLRREACLRHFVPTIGKRLSGTQTGS